jgi:hypothetical protein
MYLLELDIIKSVKTLRDLNGQRRGTLRLYVESYPPSTWQPRLALNGDGTQVVCVKNQWREWYVKHNDQNWDKHFGPKQRLGRCKGMKASR